jgi:hypothetical protein
VLQLLAVAVVEVTSHQQLQAALVAVAELFITPVPARLERRAPLGKAPLAETVSGQRLIPQVMQQPQPVVVVVLAEPAMSLQAEQAATEARAPAVVLAERLSPMAAVVAVAAAPTAKAALAAQVVAVMAAPQTAEPTRQERQIQAAEAAGRARTLTIRLLRAATAAPAS